MSSPEFPETITERLDFPHLPQIIVDQESERVYAEARARGLSREEAMSEVARIRYDETCEETTD